MRLGKSKNKKGKKVTQESFPMDSVIAEKLKGINTPILSLDSRWHELFQKEEKPADIERLEQELNDAMKEQGKLVNELKDLKKAKKKLMDEIVSGMNSMSEKQKKQNQRLILEMNERIDKNTDLVMEMPEKIRLANEKLLTAGALRSYHSISRTDAKKQSLSEEITELQELLDQKMRERSQLEEDYNKIYAYMHDLLGAEIISLFEK